MSIVYDTIKAVLTSKDPEYKFNVGQPVRVFTGYGSDDDYELGFITARMTNYNGHIVYMTDVDDRYYYESELREIKP